MRVSQSTFFLSLLAWPVGLLAMMLTREAVAISVALGLPLAATLATAHLPDPPSPDLQIRWEVASLASLACAMIFVSGDGLVVVAPALLLYAVIAAVSITDRRRTGRLPRGRTTSLPVAVVLHGLFVVVLTVGIVMMLM